MNDNQGLVEFIEMPPEVAPLLQRQYEIDRAAAGPKLAVPSFGYSGVTIESRRSVAAECERMRACVDALILTRMTRLASRSFSGEVWLMRRPTQTSAR